jgi:hypothetical protein
LLVDVVEDREASCGFKVKNLLLAEIIESDND